MMPRLLPSEEPTEPIVAPAPPAATTRWLACLAYLGGPIGLVTGALVYAIARRGSHTAWHALQAIAIGLWSGLGLGLVAIVLVLADRMLPTRLTVASAVILVLPGIVLTSLATITAAVGMREAICGRRTPLPFAHGLADRATGCG